MSIEVGLPPPLQEPEGDSNTVLRYTVDEFIRLIQLLNTGLEELNLKVLHVEPERPRDGQIVYADGTNWNPGFGEGIYAYENGAWVKL